MGNLQESGTQKIVRLPKPCQKSGFPLHMKEFHQSRFLLENETIDSNKYCFEID